MIDKRIGNASEAVADIPDGSSIMVGGFGEAGSPIELIHALIDQGASDLTVISNNTGSGEVGLAALLKARRVSKVICSFPKSANSTVFPELYGEGFTELELVPQGTLAERIRAGGAGIPAFYTPTAVGTELAEGKEAREFNGREYLLEYGLTADYALIKGLTADSHGNVALQQDGQELRTHHGDGGTDRHRSGERTSSSPDCMNPETIVTPGIFVERVVEVDEPAHESELIASGVTYP